MALYGSKQGRVWVMNSIAMMRGDEIVEFRWTEGESVVTVHRFSLSEGLGSTKNQTLSVEIARACWRDYITRGFEKVATTQ